MFLLILERGGNINWLPPEHSLTRGQTHNLWCTGQRSYQLSQLARAQLDVLMSKSYVLIAKPDVNFVCVIIMESLSLRDTH